MWDSNDVTKISNQQACTTNPSSALSKASIKSLILAAAVLPTSAPVLVGLLFLFRESLSLLCSKPKHQPWVWSHSRASRDIAPTTAQRFSRQNGSGMLGGACAGHDDLLLATAQAYRCDSGGFFPFAAESGWSKGRRQDWLVPHCDAPQPNDIVVITGMSGALHCQSINVH